MQRELMTDLKTVYYRGRYRATVAWSRIGKRPSSEDMLALDPSQTRQDRLSRPSPRITPIYRPVAF